MSLPNLRGPPSSKSGTARPPFSILPVLLAGQGTPHIADGPGISALSAGHKAQAVGLRGQDPEE